jgi:hypothetical protein
MAKAALNICEFIFGRVGFLEEKPGVKSSTRAFSFMLLCFLFYFDYILINKTDFSITAEFGLFNLVMLVGVFAPKYLQKIAEMKLGNVSEKTVESTVKVTEKSSDEQPGS